MITTCSYSGKDWRDCQCETCFCVAAQNKEALISQNELRELGVGDRRKERRNG